jgi:hypothetical protein
MENLPKEEAPKVRKPAACRVMKTWSANVRLVVEWVNFDLFGLPFGWRMGE